MLTLFFFSKLKANQIDVRQVTLFSGVARAFPGGRVAHPEGQNEEENKWSMRKNKKNWLKFEEKMRKVELLHTRDGEAGYGPDFILHDKIVLEINESFKYQHSELTT